MNRTKLNSASAYVLDDDPSVGATVCHLLSACRFAPCQFTSLAPFIAEITTAAPDLVVLDLTLGQSDAIEVMRGLETLEYGGKVLLISGHDADTLAEVARIGERLGLAMLPPLKKPFRMKELKGSLAALRLPNARKSCSGSSDGGDGVSVPLDEAIRNNWLELWYQPKVSLRSLTVSGAEVLIRARHPERGIVRPKDLLPPAGDPNYQPLSRFVIERAMADWKLFANQASPVKLAVNMPVSMIRAPDFITLVRSALPKDPEFPGLIIEITEDEVISDHELVRERATQLKLYNAWISIDDFGSGYASLSRLNDLPFVEVKIDREFVTNCSSDPLKHSLCQTVVDLAHRFGASACAEGVERVDDQSALIKMGCDTAQGFLFAKPMPRDEFLEMLAQKKMLRPIDLANQSSQRAIAAG